MDPDLQIRERPGHPYPEIRERPGHPYPEIRGSPISKDIFWLFGPQLGLKIKGDRAPRAPPLNPPLSLVITANESARELLLHASYLPDLHQLLQEFIKLLGFHKLTTRQIIAGFLHHVTEGLI